jgi:signal transduction histidine kinase
LTQLVRRLAETYETVAEERGDYFEVSVHEGLTLAGDVSLLNQLFANLIENAMKHASPHALVTLRVWRERTTIIARIEDNGPGIPVERRADALRRFGRLDKARHTPGHGLGLPLATAIAELHNAKLSLADAKTGAARPGLAVTVCFALPQDGA